MEPSEQLRVLQREMSIQWEISNYFSKTETSLCSSNFAFSDAQWNLQIYPNGSKTFPEWISLYLLKADSYHMWHKISFEMGIKKRDGSVYHSFTSSVVMADNFYSGEGTFLKRSELLNSRANVAPNDTIRVYCIMRLIYAGAAMKEYAPILLHKYVRSETVSENLKDLYLSGRYSDVIIKVMDQEFKAHKAILSARSPLLTEIIERSNLESGATVLTDCHPVAFQHFLFFLYSGKLEDISYDVAYNLYKIAAKYSHPSLKEECVKCITRGLSVNSFSDIIRIAIMHNEQELRKKTTEFFVKNVHQILPTDKWLSFVKDYHAVANELFISATSSRKSNLK